MSDTIEGMARALCAATGGNYDEMHPDGMSSIAARKEARAAWGYALAALREPSEAMQAAAMHRIGWLAIRDAVDVFAREHGLEMPPGAPQEPAGRVPADRAIHDAPEPDAPEAASLPAYRTPGGHAA